MPRDIQDYLSEQLELIDGRITSARSIKWDIQKFYFLALFSIITIASALYGIEFIRIDKDLILPLFLGVPLFYVGLSVNSVLKRLDLEIAGLEQRRIEYNQFLLGDLPPSLPLTTPLLDALIRVINYVLAGSLIYWLLKTIGLDSSKWPSWIVVVAIVGTIFVILISVFIVGISGVRARARDATRKSDIQQIKRALEIYFADKKRYPKSLDELVPEYLKEMPFDPLTSEGSIYGYEASKDKKSFTLTAGLENQNDPDGPAYQVSND